MEVACLSFSCDFFSSGHTESPLLSLVVCASSGCGVQASHCSGFFSREAQAQEPKGSVVVEHGLSCPAACGIFLDQGSNLCPLHQHAYS